VTIKCRLEFLNKCVESGIIPHGFQFSKSPALGSTSSEFACTWNSTLYRTSRDLLQLTISESKYQLRAASENIEIVTNNIIDETSVREYLTVKHKVNSAVPFTSKLLERHQNKLLRFRQKPFIRPLMRHNNTHDWWNAPTPRMHVLDPPSRNIHKTLTSFPMLHRPADVLRNP
jgi:hypothetical protein